MEDISGVMIYYYFVCKRKLWYFCKNINMENNSENVGIGKLIDEMSYSREHKHISIDQNINVDFLRDWKIIHDIKKSRAAEEASIWQIKYYIYYLEKKGIEVEKGVLDYPKLKKRIDVFLNDEDRMKLEKIMDKIREIKGLKVPLEVEKKRICKKCAYFELCYV